MDHSLFALKTYKDEGDSDIKQSIVNEASLIAFLKSDEIISCTELYDYRKTIFLVMEYMDGGSLDEIITKGHHLISEEFCRYTLYKIAKGL